MLNVFNRNDCNEAIQNEDENSKLYFRNPSLDSDGKTLMHYLVKLGNTILVKFLIDQEWDINVSDKFGTTPLLLAVEEQQTSIVEILIKNNADVYKGNNFGLYPLKCAADIEINVESESNSSKSTQSRSIMKMIIDKINADFLSDRDRIGQQILNDELKVKVSCLLFANEELTNYILTHDNNAVNYRIGISNNSILHFALLMGKFDKAKIFINRGANLNTLNNMGFTPLIYYPSETQDLDENSEVLKSLLVHYPFQLVHRVNGPSRELENLFQYGNKQTVRTVFENVIEIPAFFNNKNRTFLHLLALNENPDVMDELEELAVKFNVNARDKDGVTALHSAVQCGHVKKVEFILEHSFNVDLTLSTGGSILTAAVLNIFLEQRDKIGMVKLLLQHGAIIEQNLVDNLHVSNHRHCAKIVIAHLAFLKMTKNLHVHIPHNYIPQDYRIHFESCVRQLNLLRYIKVYDKTTLFHLLYKKQDTIISYARNKEFRIALINKIKSISDLEPYYLWILKWRVAKALEIIDLRRKSFLTIEKISGMCSDTFKLIISQIVSHLEVWDMRNLRKACNNDAVCK